MLREEMGPAGRTAWIWTASDWCTISINRASARPPLRALRIRDAQRAQANLIAIARAGVPLDLLDTLCRQLTVQLPTLSDPDMALNNLDRFFAAVAEPAGPGVAVRAGSRIAAAAAADPVHQPAPERSADPRPGELRPVAADGGPAGVPRRAGPGDLQRRGHGRGRTGRHGHPPLAQAPRDAADRLRRHRAAAPGRSGHRADLVPGRRTLRGGAAGGTAKAGGTARRPAADGRGAGAVRHPGPGQIGRPRTELLQRHRPGVPLRRRRQDRRRPADQQQRVLRPPGPAVHQVPDGEHRPGHRLPRRSAAAAGRAGRAAGGRRPGGAALLRRGGPDLGTPGLRQGPPDRGRPGTGRASSWAGWNRGSIAAT